MGLPRRPSLLPWQSLGFPLSPLLVLLLVSLGPTAQSKPLAVGHCKNQCDFYFEGFEDAVPVLPLVMGASGQARAISPRILFGRGKAVHVDASGPGEIMGVRPLKNTVERVRSLAAKREAMPVYISDSDAVSEIQGSSGVGRGGGSSAGGGLSTSQLQLHSATQWRQHDLVSYVFSALANGEQAASYVYQEPLAAGALWRAARGRCFKLPLVKLRVYYWRSKFLYLTEGDRNAHFPEHRRCVVFRAR